MKRNAKKTTKLTVEMAAAQAIVAAAKDVSRRQSDDPFPKVFLCEVYTRLAPLNPGLTLEAFKSLAAELHFAGELRLSRCDLVEAFDQTLVDDSEVHHDGST